jgi:hypothetical protein
LLSFVSNVIAGLLIGLANQSWLEVVVACAAWGFVSWLLIALLAGQASYRPGTKLLFDSPRLTRFTFWWVSGFGISLIIGTITYALRGIFASS